MRWFVIWRNLLGGDPLDKGCDYFEEEDDAYDFMANQEAKGYTCVLYAGMLVALESNRYPQQAEAATDVPCPEEL